MRELYEADVGPITAYAVHEIRTNVINEDVYEKNRWIYWLGFFASAMGIKILASFRR